MKKLLAILLACAMLLTLAACGGEPAKEPDQGQNGGEGGQEYMGIPLTDEEITLVVWESTAGADEFVIQAGKAFTQMYPNIKIEYQNVELADSKGQIALDGPAGVGPDLFASPNNTAGVLISGGHILPAANQDYLKEQLLGSNVNAITYEGEMYGYPIATEAYALFYNRALIADEEVPTSFEDLVAWCGEFNTANPGKYGFLMTVNECYYSNIFHSGAPTDRLFGEFGTDAANPNVHTETAVKTWKWMVENLRPVMDIPAADISQSGNQQMFATGQSAMFVTGLWDVATFQDAGIDFGIAPIPSLPGQDTPPEVYTTARVMYTSAYSTHVNEANAFALFMISDEMQQMRFELTGAAPSVDVTVDSDYMNGFLKQVEYGYPCPSITACDYYWEPMNSASSNIWDGADPDAELKAANDAIISMSSQ